MSTTSSVLSPSSVSFDEVVRARSLGHLEDLVAGPLDGDWRAEEERREAERRDRADNAWRRFEESQAEVLGVYFGLIAPTGAALTRSKVGEPPKWLVRLFGRRPQPRARLHIALDLVTAGDAADLVSQCERTAVRADQLLSGSERERVLRVIYERVCQIIRIVDAIAERTRELHGYIAVGAPWSSAETDAQRERRLREEQEAQTRREEQRKQQLLELKASERDALRVAATSVEQAADLCDLAVRRRALMAYFGGMLIGVFNFTLLGILLGQILAGVDITGFDLERFLTTFIAGAVGAIVSVMTRLSGSGVAIDYETGGGYLALLGAFRPLIGATFGVALYFGISSGILQASIPTDGDEVFFFFAFIAFLAGFSERWAKDMLVVGRDRIAGPQK